MEVKVKAFEEGAGVCADAGLGVDTGAGVGNSGSGDYLFAALRYQRSLRPTLEHYAGFYKQTAVSHSTDGAL